MTNQELASYYYRLATIRYHGDITMFTSYKKRIAECNVNIAEHYKNTGNLNVLGLKSSTSKISILIKLILDYGFKEAKNIISNNRTLKI